MLIHGVRVNEENFCWKANAWLEPGVSLDIKKMGVKAYACFSAHTPHADRKTLSFYVVINEETTEGDYLQAQNCAIQARREYIQSLYDGAPYKTQKWLKCKWREMSPTVDHVPPFGLLYSEYVQKRIVALSAKVKPKKAKKKTKKETIPRPDLVKGGKKRWFTNT